MKEKRERTMKREKANVIENSNLIHFTNHSPADKLAGLNSISTNCKLCDNCIMLHKKGLEQKAVRAGLIELIEKEDARIDRQFKKTDKTKINMDIVNDARKKRADLIHKLNKIHVLVCAFCFADNTLEMRPSVAKALTRNTELLTTKILDLNEIPFINRLFFRFESFGDLHNTIQAINYINIARKNPNCTFAWWTKRPAIIEQAMKELEITELPANIICIFSSYYLNRINTEIHKRFDFINIVFTVFDKWYLIEHPEIEITCGKRQCMNCFQCYTKPEKGTVIYINELVK